MPEKSRTRGELHRFVCLNERQAAAGLPVFLPEQFPHQSSPWARRLLPLSTVLGAGYSDGRTGYQILPRSGQGLCWLAPEFHAAAPEFQAGAYVTGLPEADAG